MRRRRRSPSLFRLVIALAALWLLASVAMRVGVGRARMERAIGERLGLDISIARLNLRLSGLLATGISGKLPNDPADSDPVFLAESLRISPRSIRVEDAVLVIVERTDGSTVPACFASCVADLDATSPDRPCPVRVLAPLASSLWPANGKPRSTTIQNATLLFRDYEGFLHPVFTGLEWQRGWTSLPVHGSVEHTRIAFRSFGPATASDGRPGDGTPGTMEWLGGHDMPVQILWGKRQPCGEESEVRSPKSEVENPAGSNRRADRESGGEP